MQMADQFPEILRTKGKEITFIELILCAWHSIRILYLFLFNLSLINISFQGHIYAS